MTPLTLITDRGVGGTPRVTAAGEIDISNIHVFTEALTTASEGNSKPITVDMSAVKYLDSAGVNVLFKHADEIDRLRTIRLLPYHIEFADDLLRRFEPRLAAI